MAGGFARLGAQPGQVVAMVLPNRSVGPFSLQTVEDKPISVASM